MSYQRLLNQSWNLLWSFCDLRIIVVCVWACFFLLSCLIHHYVSLLDVWSYGCMFCVFIGLLLLLLSISMCVMSVKVNKKISVHVCVSVVEFITAFGQDVSLRRQFYDNLQQQKKLKNNTSGGRCDRGVNHHSEAFRNIQSCWQTQHGSYTPHKSMGISF